MDPEMIVILLLIAFILGLVLGVMIARPRYMR
jgi:uncharacterized protein YneF (UPF0154 family)